MQVLVKREGAYSRNATLFSKPDEFEAATKSVRFRNAEREWRDHLKEHGKKQTPVSIHAANPVRTRSVFNLMAPLPIKCVA